MITEIFAFTTFFILVFGGAIACIVRFALFGHANSRISSRMSETRFEEALDQKTNAGNTASKNETFSHVHKKFA